MMPWFFFAAEFMSEDYIMEICTRALVLIMLLSAPMLLSALAVGLLISIIQATTQIQEQTLSSVPKMAITFISLIGIISDMITKGDCNVTLILFGCIPYC